MYISYVLIQVTCYILQSYIFKFGAFILRQNEFLHVLNIHYYLLLTTYIAGGIFLYYYH